MTTSLIHIGTTPIRACASSGHQKPDRPATSKNPSAGWWSPLFGWSSEPDYIDSPASGSSKSRSSELRSSVDPRPAGSRIAPGGFTEEKARRLRMMTLDTASFHDAMYHSAIASRLASDFGIRSGSDL